MALGPTTYKTPNIINRIFQDLSGSEGCGLTLGQANYVFRSNKFTDNPYGIVVVGAKSTTDTYYPSGTGEVAAASLEIVDQLGCAVQVAISETGGVTAGEWLQIDGNVGNGTFCSVQNGDGAVGNWIWGLCLTDADANQQCLMRFQPYVIYSSYVPA